MENNLKNMLGELDLVDLLELVQDDSTPIMSMIWDLIYEKLELIENELSVNEETTYEVNVIYL